MTLPSLVSFPRPHTTAALWEIYSRARPNPIQLMANSNGNAEVEKTPSKDVTTDAQNEGTEEDGANGQQPDSMSMLLL
jgi:hypothetical protein